MKTLIIIIISWLSIRAFTLPADYRDSYTGTYNCKEIHRHLNSRYEFVHDTSSYTLLVNKSLEDSTLTIITREGNLHVKLLGKHFRNATGRHSSGRFSGDSIFVVNIPSAGPTSYSYYGKK